MSFEAKKLVKKLDRNGDGKVSIEEFHQFFEKKARLSAKFSVSMKKKGN